MEAAVGLSSLAEYVYEQAVAGRSLMPKVALFSIVSSVALNVEKPISGNAIGSGDEGSQTTNAPIAVGGQPGTTNSIGLSRETDHLKASRPYSMALRAMKLNSFWQIASNAELNGERDASRSSFWSQMRPRRLSRRQS